MSVHPFQTCWFWTLQQILMWYDYLLTLILRQQITIFKHLYNQVLKNVMSLNNILNLNWLHQITEFLRFYGYCHFCFFRITLVLSFLSCQICWNKGILKDKTMDDYFIYIYICRLKLSWKVVPLLVWANQSRFDKGFQIFKPTKEKTLGTILISNPLSPPSLVKLVGKIKIVICDRMPNSYRNTGKGKWEMNNLLLTKYLIIYPIV